jgi:hypothetical protein
MRCDSWVPSLRVRGCNAQPGETVDRLVREAPDSLQPYTVVHGALLLS